MTLTKTRDSSREEGIDGKDARPWPATVATVVGAILIGATLFLASGCDDIVIERGSGGSWSDSDEPIETRDDSFTVGSSPRLVVGSFNGRIAVSVGSDNSIRVQATLKRADKIDYEVSQDGDTVSVKARQKERTTGRSPGADIEVVAPSSARVELRTSNGMIELRGMEESGTLETSNGKIVVEDVRGNLDARTSNGSINVTELEGSVDLETSNGAINFDGELTPGGRNEMGTSNGSVNVTLRGKPSIHLDATTSNGTASSKLPITATSTGDNHLAGTIGDGEAELVIHTSNGSVTVR
ncbi:DUF4097 domain-containing protein [Chloroflexota bacterium]